MITREIFDIAYAHEEAYKQLLIPKHISYRTATLHMLPAITCAALSLELYFKCLISVEGMVAPKGHKFSKLLMQLTNKSRNLIYQEFKNLTKAPSLTEDEFVSSLTEIDDVYTNSRYIFEHDNLSIDMNQIDATIQAVKSAIKSKHPEF